jgi:riboflavin transporter FmnP
VLVAGTAVLGAVVAVLELSRFLRIPFPLLPFLKFDIIGIPMVIGYLSFGLLSGAATCFVSFAIISFRNPFSGFMKCLAELSTIIGAYIILRSKRMNTSLKSKTFAVCSSIISRVVIMAVANVLFFPLFGGLTAQTVIALLPFTCPFNAIQGAISIIGGLIVHEAIVQRLPSLRT